MQEEEGEVRSAPSSESEGIDWEALAAKIHGGTVDGLGKYALGFFLNNEVRAYVRTCVRVCLLWHFVSVGRKSSVSACHHHLTSTQTHKHAPFQDTDTQGAVWLNKKSKEMVLCFRGTEIGWKDLLTDALIIQQPLDGTKQGVCQCHG